MLAGQQETFYSLTADVLANVVPEEVGVDRPSARCDRYAIGTVARIDLHDRRYLLAALSHTDLSSLKADASVQDLWVCLAGVWKEIRDPLKWETGEHPAYWARVSQESGFLQSTWSRSSLLRFSTTPRRKRSRAE